MENRPQSVLNIRDQAYALAYSLASEQLASLDLEAQCFKSGAKCIDSTKAIIHYLNRPYVISVPDVQISLVDSEEEVPLKDKILILHYLTSAKGTAATGRLITFKQLPGCASYFPVFEQLSVRPLLKYFGEEPESLIGAAAKLGGYEAKLGDVGITINAFRRVPISIAMWRGDEEFAPRANIMFDGNIPDYLPTEDIRDICAIIARRLIGFGKRQQ